MAQCVAFDPNVEVVGTSILIVIDTMGLFASLAKTIFAKHGITEVKETEWYPLQVYLDVYREITEHVGQRTLRQIGKQIPEKALWPTNITTIDDALPSIDVAYHMNHRGGDIGTYTFEKIDDTSGIFVCDNPYPCALDEGIIDGTAKKFAPRPSRVRVAHDPDKPCRMDGADSCTYRVLW